jgi:hypothetical protein
MGNMSDAALRPFGAMPNRSIPNTSSNITNEQAAQVNLKRLSTDRRSIIGRSLGGSNPVRCASKSKETKHG